MFTDKRGVFGGYKDLPGQAFLLELSLPSFVGSFPHPEKNMEERTKRTGL